MDKLEKEKAKANSQAWRKKPRNWAPRSRLGCKTCKVRRIKCDQVRPFCMKCVSTGRKCDGYDEMLPTFQAEIVSSHPQNEAYNGVWNCHSSRLHSQVTEDPTSQWHTIYGGPSVWQSLQSLMILPTTGSGQAEAMTFFEYTSIKHLSEYHLSESWRNTLMYFSQTVPSVRHAAIALALIHRTYLDRDSGNGMYQPPITKGLPPQDKAPLYHYNRAIQLLLSQGTGGTHETKAITLLVCYLFYCFDHLAGNHVQAIKHLSGGVELSRDIEKHRAKINNNNATGLHSLVSQITKQIQRLNFQTTVFLIDWEPLDIQDMPESPLALFDNGCQSLDHASDQLCILSAQAMKWVHSELKKDFRMSGLPSASTVLEKLERWSILFENMLQRDHSYYNKPSHRPLLSLLRIQQSISWILLSCFGRGKEMEYDNYVPQFKRCVTLANDVVSAHEQYSGSLKLTFTPEITVLPVLYAIGAKCRDPLVRREALSILRRRPMREAVWDSVTSARVVERMIEIEESGSENNGTVKSMEEIAVWQRIDTLSWTQFINGDSEAKVDIRYTFCAQEETYTESLMVY